VDYTRPIRVRDFRVWVLNFVELPFIWAGRGEHFPVQLLPVRVKASSDSLHPLLDAAGPVLGLNLSDFLRKVPEQCDPRFPCTPRGVTFRFRQFLILVSL
jgi:hypothetical protein